MGGLHSNDKVNVRSKTLKEQALNSYKTFAIRSYFCMYLSEGLASTVSKALCCFQNQNGSSGTIAVYKLVTCLN